MRERILFVPVGGEIISIGDPPIALEGEVKKERASHILPVNRGLRAAFLLLRWAFGEEGRVAAWTRTWRCRWYTEIIATGETFTSRDRQACLDWERRKLERMYER